MARLAARCALALGLALLTGCTTGQLLRRYATRSHVEQRAGVQHAHLSAFVTPVPASPPSRAFLELSASAQERLIQVLGGMVDSPDALYAALGDFLAEGAPPQPVIDTTVFRRRVVVSLLRDFDAMREPADRFDELDLRLVLDGDPRFELVSWDRFSTRDEEIDLGRISLVRGVETELGLEGEARSAGGVLGGAFQRTLSRERSEQTQLTERRVVLAGALAPREARLYQRGARNVDLTGTFAVDLVVRAPRDESGEQVVRFRRLREGEAWLDAATVSFERLRLAVPATCEPARLALRGRYRVRHVATNDGTLSEGDDEAVYIRGSVAAEASPILVSRDDLALFVWRLVDPRGSELELGGLDAPDAPDRSGALHFRTPEEAFEFLTWLRETRSLDVRGRRLALLGDDLALRALRADDVAHLGVESLALNDCGGG